MKKSNILYSIAIIILLGSACQKYLDKKPDKQLVIPSTLKDIQALYDQNNIMNGYGSTIGEASADNYYMSEASFNSLADEHYKEMYTWGRDIFRSASNNEWSRLYDIVYQSNVGLETLNNVVRNSQNGQQWDNLKGTGLFFRSYSFQQALFNWSLAYDSLTCGKDLGIPLRLNSDFNEVSKRATVQQSYQQVISDLKKATILLPNHPTFVTRPSKAAAYGLLARIYLDMGNYKNARTYADSCINIFSGELLDYNTLNSSKTYPITAFNNEIIFYDVAITAGPLGSTYAKVDTNLYGKYKEDDLRKKLFFKPNTDGSISFRGSYIGKSSYFVGISLDEMYLVRSECLARLGNIDQAISDLNYLLVKRYKTGTFQGLNESNPQAMLAYVLDERRKELLFRDLRWMDIKRLNKDGYGISLQRILGDKHYSLTAGSNGFALPIPISVIDLTGMQQNPE